MLRYNGFNYNFATSSLLSVPSSRRGGVIITSSSLIIMLSCEEHPVAVNHVGFLYSLLLSFFRSLLISSGASFLQVRIFCDRKLLDLELNFSQRIPISNIIPGDGLQFTKFIHRTLKVDTTRLCVGGWISPFTVAGGLCWKLLWLFNHTHQVLLPT